MGQDALINKIAHNIASGTAIQYNIQFNLRFDKADPESLQRKIREFLISLGQPEENKASSQTNIGTHGPIEQGPPGLSQSRCFELLDTFKRDWFNRINDYCQSSRTVIETLDQEDLKSIATWLASCDSAILLIDGNEEDEEPESTWMTDLVLEMVDVFRSANNGDGANNNTVVTHLCSEESSMNYGEEGVLQSIIAQIIEADPDWRENPGKYQHVGLPEGTPHSIEYKSEELWDIIVKCLKLARTRILVIILDHVEKIFQPDDQDRFQQFVNELRDHIRDIYKRYGVLVKIMVTCDSNQGADYFRMVGALPIVILDPPRQQPPSWD